MSMKKSPTFVLLGSDRTPRVCEPGEQVWFIQMDRTYEAVDARVHRVMGMSKCLECDANGRNQDCLALRCGTIVHVEPYVYYREVTNET